MIEFQPYPKALYHPTTKELHIVKDKKEHEALEASWIEEPVSKNDETNVVDLPKRKGGRPKKVV